MRSALVEAAHAATHAKDSYLSAQYQRLALRRGGKKATIADVAAYAVARYASEAGIDIGAYRRVLEWKRRFEALPGFVTPEQSLPLETRLL